MKKRTRFFRGFKKSVVMMFFGLIIVFLAGSEITIRFNPTKAKKTLWDRFRDGIKVAQQIRGVM